MTQQNSFPPAPDAAPEGSANTANRASESVGESSPVLIIGATSEIARSLAHMLAKRGHGIWLAGRDAAELDRLDNDLAIRHGVATRAIRFDAEADEPAAWSQALPLTSGAPLGGLVLALGFQAWENEVANQPELADRMDRINHRVPAELLATLHDKVAADRFVVAISSVAGDRVRPSVASYARSKASLNAAVRKMQDKQQPPPITLIKPGRVDTRLTWSLAGGPPPAAPEAVAADIARAIDRRKPLAYTPWKWRWIMLIVRSIPGPIFRRLFANA